MPTDRMNPATLTPRAREVLDAARELLETEGYEALSMRRLGSRLGIRAPALYRHFEDKRALENALIFQALWETGDVALAAIDGADDPLVAIATAYRRWALEHPHLYRLLYARPLDRERLDPSAEHHGGEALRQVMHGDLDGARTFWAFAHGMAMLELDGRFPPGSDLDRIWSIGLEALRKEIGV